MTQKSIPGIFLLCRNKVLLGTIFFLFLSGNIRLFSGAKPTFHPGSPDLIEIATVFSQNFTIEDIKISYSRLQFIRNPSGWQVVLYSHEGTPAKKIELWSNKHGYPEGINPGKNDTTFHLTEIVGVDDLYEFDIYPFYGYKGWTLDVMDAFGQKDKNDLTDNELYGLGLAYSQSASDILWSHSRFSIPENCKAENAKKKDLRRYLKYSRKAFESFQILAGRNPDYQTRVGSIGLKYANEVTARYYELSLFGFAREARRVSKISGGLDVYPLFWNDYARNVLQTLKPNSILFTNGDNDTYPMLSMQLTSSIGKNVRIINLSLLNDPMYLTLLDKNFYPKNDVTGGMKDILPLWPETPEIILESTDDHLYNYPFKQILKEINTQKTENHSQLVLPVGGYIIPFLSQEGLFDTLVISLGDQGREAPLAKLYAGGLIYFNAGKTPIYFIKEMQPAIKAMFVSEHLVDKGLIYEVEKHGESDLLFEKKWYDREGIEKMQQTSIELQTGLPDHTESLVINLFLEAEAILIYSEKEMDRRYRMMSRFIEKFPPQLTGVNHYLMFIADDLYASGEYMETAQVSMGNYYRLLTETIFSISRNDFTPWGRQQNMYLSSLVKLFGNTRYLQDNPDLKPNLEACGKIIDTELMKFPAINFE